MNIGNIEYITAISKSMSHPARVRILAILRMKELCVCDLMEALGLSKQTVSNHLMVLRKVKLVVREKRGNWFYYNISPEFEDIHKRMQFSFDNLNQNDPIVGKDIKKTSESVCAEYD